MREVKYQFGGSIPGLELLKSMSGNRNMSMAQQALSFAKGDGTGKVLLAHKKVMKESVRVKIEPEVFKLSD